ncbi:hypothetical protein BR63_03335 [Thermanaerosceptrum fracticalcis]|jgi:hypothetical protein|uniref:Uncharacterized protein n=1 Tax=Thermanaerosceptrum fracticalcis TaxID=1712410 RepID=A0A7G6E030_THEFR|nr:hypothetical protein [Thermanaerosceptrum fracticalcis]QNB45434.1 hypothetical protein BR63_03335 [Thermanaerosceptrum fracticalcis]
MDLERTLSSGIHARAAAENFIKTTTKVRFITELEADITNNEELPDDERQISLSLYNADASCGMGVVRTKNVSTIGIRWKMMRRMSKDGLESCII